jgi:hypothetical protein
VTVHQCPKCELRFTWQTELDVHCRDEHPDFHHDYPTRAHLLKHPPTEAGTAQQAVREPK